tara:strand:- start:1163 stop:1393 length:231 start_codon:yes stop_codon:yes gene_type:complete
MKEPFLLSVKDAAQFLFGDYDRSSQDRTRQLINKFELQKYVIGKRTYVVKKELADKFKINESAKQSDKVVKLKDRG